MRRLAFLLAPLALFACGEDSKNTPPDMKMNPFMPVPECKPDTLKVSPLMGDRQLLISSLAIADRTQGFDLNGDGVVDNKLWALNSLANPAIADTFKFQQSVIVPIELFGYTGADSDCTKAAFYLGRWVEDRDGDGKSTDWEAGKTDCDDTNPAVHGGATEDLTNRMDDDCDGYADNMNMGVAPMDTMDLDGDGQSPAQGDCDDRMGEPIAAMRHKGAKDVCGDGIDEDCDGIPDNDPSCDPYADNKVSVHVTALSFEGNPMAATDGGVIDPAGQKPVIVFPDGNVKGGVLTAGPDLFKLSVPFQKDINITLEITGAHLRIALDDKPLGTYIDPGTPPNGLLGGVLEAASLAQVKGINAGGVISPDESLLDAIFVGPAGTILALDTDQDGHYLPDIDVDGDGLETFWQENKLTTDGGKPIDQIDTCKDGDGTVIHNNFDGMGTPCTLARDAKGNYRFVDGLSVALRFTAVPVKIGDVVEK